MRESATLILKHSTAYPFKVTRNTLIQCCFCPDNFEDPVEFRRHVDCSHFGLDRSSAFTALKCVRIDITDMFCRLCAAAHDTLASLAEHLRTHHDLAIDPNVQLNLLPIKLEKDSLICATCNRSFNCHRELSKHLYVHSLGLICHICGKQFQTITGLKCHTAEKHSSTFKCIQCKLQFASTEERIQHVRENKSCWPYSCGICKERFHFWEARQTHLEQVHGKEKITFPCKKCSVVFEKRIQLYFHIKKTHSEELKCQVCEESFRTKKELLEHGYSHSGERPYQCPLCDASFAKSRIFDSHLKIHDDAKKLSCPACSKLFVERSKIKMHVCKHHPDIFEEWAVSMNFKM